MGVSCSVQQQKSIIHVHIGLWRSCRVPRTSSQGLHSVNVFMRFWPTTFSVFILARFVSKITNFLRVLHELEKQQSEMQTVLAYFQRNNLRGDLRERVRLCIQSMQRDVMMQRQVKEEDIVLHCLPTALKRKVI